MDSIAKHMGISKRTIYENFKDKNELLEACITDEYEKTKKDEHLIMQSDNVLESMIRYLKNKEKPEYKRIKLGSELRRYHPDVALKVLDTCGAESFERFCRILEIGIRQGYFRRDINPKTLAFILSTQALSLLSERFEKTEAESLILSDFSAYQAFEDMFYNFLRGISTPKGIEVIEKENN